MSDNEISSDLSSELTKNLSSDLENDDPSELSKFLPSELSSDSKSKLPPGLLKRWNERENRLKIISNPILLSAPKYFAHYSNISMRAANPEIPTLNLPKDLWDKITLLNCNCSSYAALGAKLHDSISEFHSCTNTPIKLLKYQRIKLKKMCRNNSPQPFKRIAEQVTCDIIPVEQFRNVNSFYIVRNSRARAVTYHNKQFYNGGLMMVYFNRFHCYYPLNERRLNKHKCKEIVNKRCMHKKYCSRYIHEPVTKSHWCPPIQHVPILIRLSKLDLSIDTVFGEEPLEAFPQEILFTNAQWTKRYVFETIQISKAIDRMSTVYSSIGICSTDTFYAVYGMQVIKMIVAIMQFNARAAQFSLNPERHWASFGKAGGNVDNDSGFDFPYSLIVYFKTHDKTKLLGNIMGRLNLFNCHLKEMQSAIRNWKCAAWMIGCDLSVYSLTDKNPYYAYIAPCGRLMMSEQKVFEQFKLAYTNEYVVVPKGSPKDTKLWSFYLSKTLQFQNLF